MTKSAATDLVATQAMTLRSRFARCLVALLLINSSNFVVAQPALNQAATEPAEGFVRLNLQGNIKLQALIDLIGKRLDWKFLYDAEVANRQINVKTPQEIPVDTLPALLSSVLRMENLALVDADVPGWKRIIDAGEMIGHAASADAQAVFEQDGAAAPVTQAFAIKHLDVQQLTTLIRPFATKTGSNILPVPGSNMILVTDYAPNLLTIEKLIELIDRPAGEASYEVYKVENATSGQLAEQVQTMLVGTATTLPTLGATLPTSGAAGTNVGLFDEPRTNQIVVIGAKPLVEQALELLKKFDVPLGLSTVVYRLQYVKAERIDKIVQGFLNPNQEGREYQSTIDKEGNLLVVRTNPEIHQRIEELKEQIDVPVKGEESPIRFYKLKNANATDVLYTLLALQEVSGGSGVLGFGASPGQTATPGTAPEGSTPLSININSAQQQPQGFNPYSSLTDSRLGLGLQSPAAGLFRNFPAQNYFGGFQNLNLPLTPYEDPTATYGNIQQFGRDRLSSVLGPQLATGGVATLPGGARVSADISTNSLVIVAPTEVQELYGRLIESLDVRRPQVMIDAKIVAIDTSDDFRLGVEFSGGDRTGDKRIFSFTSFGLSEVDPVTGALTIMPSLGFNGALVDPDVADVVVQALSAHSRVDVLASPRILVNDNATGELQSVTSVPFESVNASTTIATTSLGGNQQAGTTITVTPHIKEDDHLQMEFSLEFSSFADTGGTATLPPPRRIERVGSAVTIPSGHTVIVGGLQRVGETKGRTGLPYAEAIPIIRNLTSLTARDTTTTSFFVFLRPVILRDERFDDLKYLSDVSKQSAGIPSEHPVSVPMLME